MIFWLITEPDNLLVVMPLTRATCSQLCLNTLSRWLPLTFVTLVTLCHMLSLVCSNSPLLPMSHSLVCSLTETETCDCPTPALTACTWAPGPGGRDAAMTHSAHTPAKSCVGFTLLKYVGDSPFRKPTFNSTVSSPVINIVRDDEWSEKDELLSSASGPTLPPSHWVVIPIKAAQSNLRPLRI